MLLIKYAHCAQEATNNFQATFDTPYNAFFPLTEKNSLNL